MIQGYKRKKVRRDGSPDTIGDRYRQVLRYIAELDRLRSPTARVIKHHPDSIDLSCLPRHQDVIWDTTNQDAFLVVKRCDPPPSPPLPKTLEGWVEFSPNQVTQEPARQACRTQGGTELSWEVHGPEEDWNKWISSWRDWAEKSRPAYEARELYWKLYDWHGKLERNSEQLELVAADVSVALQYVDHPILINPVRINFDAEHSKISVGCLDEPTQVYGDAIRDILPESGVSIAKAREEVAENLDLWAFGGIEVDRFAKRFVQGADPGGEFVDNLSSTKHLTARRHPWLLLRKRATGLAELAESLISKFDEDGVVPKPIRPILMDEEQPRQEENGFKGEPDEDEGSYFTKPANAEQLAILNKYRYSGCVQVQGPPGTGKTHTIANLIGHFLAEGKRVLVTSEKAQALSVLRDQVVEELRPLCASLVGLDVGESLKSAMQGLHENLSDPEPSRLESDIDRLKSARKRTIEDLKRARQTMRQIIENERLPIEVSGKRNQPHEAGKLVHQERITSGWIPGIVSQNSEPPLTEEEFKELIDLLSQYPANIVCEVRKPLPPESDVPTPASLEKLLKKIGDKERETPSEPAVVTTKIQEKSEPFEAVSLLEKVENALRNIESLEHGYRALANRFVETPSILIDWQNRLKEASEILEMEQRAEIEAAPYEFKYTPGKEADISSYSKDLLAYVRRKRRPIAKARLFNSNDKQLFQLVKFNRRYLDEPSLKALIQLVEFHIRRDTFRAKIRHAAKLVGFEDYGGDEPESFLLRDDSLKTAMQWQSQCFEVINGYLARFDNGFEKFASLPLANTSANGPVDKRAWWLKSVVKPMIVQFLHQKELEELTKRKEVLRGRVQSWLKSKPSKPLQSLAKALLNENLPAYQDAYDELQELRASVEPVQRRDALLDMLRSRAEDFAAQLEQGSFQTSKIQSTLAQAWNYALINQELQRRHELNLEQTKKDLEALKRRLDKTTIKLARALAWANQHKRVTQPVLSALSRYHDAQRKIGRGTGKRVPELREAMRKAMREAKEAFPVWIMPLTEVAKSFDFTKTRFDVVIVDESSQVSAVGLITLLIADSAIVVGDDEQTEPLLVGVTYESVKSLIDEHLVDFDDRVLWSPDTSLYSFAGRFGATVALREHFRCVPEIISFSSRLCYQGKIQPLRESRGVIQIPHVVPVACQNAGQDIVDKVNEAEALKIASLLISCYEQPEYQGQTFGVIALRGSADSRGSDPQTSLVEKTLKNALSASDYENLVSSSKLKLGVPSAFQGDERDVVFISVGDAPALSDAGSTAPLKMLSADSNNGATYKKRLNVAVSRARNQVWIVHSFQHFEAELKEGDIRRQLLEFAYNPEQWLEATRAKNPAAESPFEQDVYSNLVRLGYNVTPQVPVGHYRIDMVVENEHTRIAIECDGEAYHQDAAADLSRQLVLERCGWRFIRIRGSEYYSDPERAIDRIDKELKSLGASPKQHHSKDRQVDGELLRRVRERAEEVYSEIQTARSVKTGIGSTMTGEAVAQDDQVTGEKNGWHSDATDSSHLDKDKLPRLEVIAPLKRPVVSTKENRVESTSIVIRGALIQVEKYVQFAETDYGDPKTQRLEEVQKTIHEILQVEGPATKAIVLDRYRVAIGYGRLKGPTKDKIETALDQAVRSGTLIAQADYPGSSVMVYSLPGQPTMRFRTRGPRDLYDIPMTEIVNLAMELFRAKLATDENDLLRLMLEFYGLQRLTAQAEERLHKACDLALDKVRHRTDQSFDNALSGNSKHDLESIKADALTLKAEWPAYDLERDESLQNYRLDNHELDEHKPIAQTPFCDNKKHDIRVRILSSSGKEVVSSGTVIGQEQGDDYVKYTVLVENSQEVRKFLSPPAIVERLN